MAQRRMFSPAIVGSDAFLDMPTSTRELYFQLGMYSDDDGFINPRKIIRMVGASDDDIKILIGKRFIIPFEDGVVVIKHWKINNLLQKDRYHPTVYREHFLAIKTKENGAYTESVNKLLPQVRLGKVRLGKVIKEGEEKKYSPTPEEFFDKGEKGKDLQFKVLKWLTDKGVKEVIALQELNKFNAYWNEPSKSGTKVRWQGEKFFDIQRRLHTWFSNVDKFSGFKGREDKPSKFSFH